MAYKTQFRPLERLGRDGWRRTDEVDGDTVGDDLITLPTRRIRNKLLIEA
jgi:arginine-tRNA-protein transferase